MVDASSFGAVCVKVLSEKDMLLILDSIKGETDLVLTQDLIINDKILDEGKHLGMVRKELVKSVSQVRHELATHHIKIADRHGAWKYDPPVDLTFLNMSAVQKSCEQIGEQMRQKDAAASSSVATAETDDEGEDDHLEDSMAPVSYAVPKRDWVVPETSPEDVRRTDAKLVEGGAPTPLESSSAAVRGRAKEKQITRYMTAEPNSKGVVKVYIEEPAVVECESKQISVSFSMNTYTLRVKAALPLVLGPIECGVIDPEASSWQLSRGKRLTLSLVLSEAGKENARIEKRAAEMQARMAAKKAQADNQTGTEAAAKVAYPEQKASQVGPEAACDEIPKPSSSSCKAPGESRDSSRGMLVALAVAVLLVLLAVLIKMLA